jgi:DNA repair exonuclease SbcCD ATPase subunit
MKHKVIEYYFQATVLICFNYCEIEHFRKNYLQKEETTYDEKCLNLSILAKVEEESVATRSALNELKEDLRNLYEETKQNVDMLEKKMKTMEKNFKDLSKWVFTIMQNICTSLVDSQDSQGVN